jgi:hypothetical protein
MYAMLQKMVGINSFELHQRKCDMFIVLIVSRFCCRS